MKTSIYVTLETDGLLLSIDSRDREMFRQLIDEFKHGVPPHQRRFDKDLKVWRVSNAGLPWLEIWLGNVRYHYSDVEIIRNSQSTPRAPRPEIAEAFAALHLLPSAPPEMIRAAFKVLAQIHHPDKGGNHSEMVKVNQAFERLNSLIAA